MTESSGASDGETVEATLLDAGVLVPTDGDDHRVDPTVRTDLDREFDRLNNPNAERERLRALLDMEVVVSRSEDDAQVDAEETGDGFELRRDGTAIGRWPSRLAFRTDLALAGALEARIEDWNALPTAKRGNLLSGARLFLESCPDCESALSFRASAIENEETGEREVALLVCEECDAALFVADGAT